jgi:acetyltransferase-like isoleucine patch superfamily enzyme
MGDIKIASDALVCEGATLQVSRAARLSVFHSINFRPKMQGSISIGSGTVVHPRCQLIAECLPVIRNA